MNKRSIAIAVIVFLMCAAVSAQTYSVRVTYNSNLRASYSLQARVVSTAAAGATLTVTGRHEKWLKIDRNGREVWMADWIPMTRVDGPQAPADVDNCCFVDRQCNTDHEWTAGYWAHQNNQCGAPAAAVTETSTPATPTTAADANNCCQVGWHCQTEHEWERGFWNYQVGQCEHPGVFMEGSEPFKATMDAALKLLRDRSPHWYAYTLEGLSKIREVAGSRIRVFWPGGENQWGRDVGMLSRREISSIAALLAHEACHIHRSRSGQEPGGVGGETACVQLEIQVLDSLGSYPGRRNWLSYLLDNIHDPAVQWWH